MTGEHTGLGVAARALLDSGSRAYAELDSAELREGIVELVAAQESAYLTYEMPEIDIALARVLLCEVRDVDDRLVEWLGARPTAARLGVTSRALWQLWSPANPHSPIDPISARRLMAAAARVHIGEFELGAYLAALRFAAEQIDEAGTLAAIDRELARLTTPADPS
jgi:hypothetical protein